MDTPRPVGDKWLKQVLRLSRADEKALLFRPSPPTPLHLQLPQKETRMRFQSKIPTQGWISAHPQVWLAEVLETMAEKTKSSSSAVVIFDEGTAMEIHWRIKPRDKTLIEEIRLIVREGLNNKATPNFKSRQTAEAIYDILEEKGLI